MAGGTRAEQGAEQAKLLCLAEGGCVGIQNRDAHDPGRLTQA